MKTHDRGVPVRRIARRPMLSQPAPDGSALRRRGWGNARRAPL